MSALDPNRAFLGIGWQFPVGAAGADIAMAAYDEDVRQAVLIVLRTNHGERVMRPEFGAGLRDFLFEPVNPSTMALVRTRVQDALIDWEPRILLESVDVTTSDERNVLNIRIAYRVRATNTLHNFVYPFYLQEGAEA